ncbi:hypothetical protein [Streptomyces sp. NPDC017958]|uniref:hypothetical protein n=1 Tax=Streptomyces TaxID=1883 RepID=UPI0037B967F1
MTAPQEPPAGPQPPPGRSPVSTFVEKAALVAAPGTIALALLYYFGSLYIREYYSTLGVVPEDLGMSIQNVMANSTSAIFLPLCVLLAGGLIVFLVFGWLEQALAGPEHAVRRRARSSCCSPSASPWCSWAFRLSWRTRWSPSRRAGHACSCRP